MISVVIWSFAAAGIFLWNYFKVPYIGIRLAGYCLVRYLVRRRKDGRGAGG